MARSRRVDDVVRAEPPVATRVERASTAVAVTRGHQPESPSGSKERHGGDTLQDTVHSRAGRQRIRAFSHDDEAAEELVEPAQAIEVLASIRDEVARDFRLVSSATAFLTATSGEPLLTHWHLD